MRYVKPYFILFLLNSICYNSFAQPSELKWSNNTSSTYYANYFKTTVFDSNGNSYLFSFFEDTVEIETISGHQVIGVEKRSTLLQKIDSMGTTLWYKLLDIDGFSAATTDNNGNVIFIGTNQYEDMSMQLILKQIDSQGKLIQEQKIFQTIPQKYMSAGGIQHIEVGNDGSIFLVGTSMDTLSIKRDYLSPDYVNENYNGDIFMIKLDQKGNTLWNKSLKGSRREYTFDSSLDDENNLYITGIFSKDIILNDIVHKANGNNDMFIYKVSSLGEDVFFSTIGGRYSDNGKALSVDKNQNVYITGGFGDTVDFDPGPNTEVHVCQGSSDAYLLKLNHEGEFQWVKIIGEKGGGSMGLSVKAVNDKVYWSGDFKGEIDFDPSKTVLKLSSAGDAHYRHSSTFIQINESSGKFLDAIVLDEYLIGQVKKVSFIDEYYYQVIGSIMIQENKENKHYNLNTNRYQYKESNVSDTITVCDSYYWDVTGETYSASGTYSGKIRTQNKKKEIVKLHLNIYKMNTDVVYNGFDIRAQEQNARYQWLDCTGDFVPVIGEVASRFIATKSGSYCLQLTSTMCDKVDTSRQIKIVVKEIDKETLENYYQVDFDVLIDDLEKVHIPLDGSKVKMIPFRVDEYYGFVKNDAEMSWIVQPKFEQVFAVYETGAIVKDSTYGGYGFINNKGEYVIPPYFNQIIRERNVLHAIRGYVNDSSLHLPSNYDDFNYHAYFDLNGKELFTENAHEHDSFGNEDFAWFRFGKSYHIRNIAGDLVDSFQVNDQKYFLGIADSNLIYRVEVNYMDTIVAVKINGQTDFRLPVNTWAKVFKIEDNFFGIMTSDHNYHNYFFKDSLGKDLSFSSETGYIDFTDSDSNFFKQDYFVVRDKESNMAGVIDRTGKNIIPFQYERISPMVNGYWTCFNEFGRASYINSEGEIILKDNFPVMGSYGRQVNKYLLANIKGFYDDLSFGWTPYHHVDTMTDGSLDYVDSSYYMYYDIKGDVQLTLDTTVQLTGNFSEGLAPAVDTNKALGFINKQGEWAIQPLYELVLAGSYPMPYIVTPEFKGGYAYIKSHKGYVDKNGREYFKGKRMQDHYDFSH